MKLFLTTAGRPWITRQWTLQYMPAALRRKVIMVLQPKDVEPYAPVIKEFKCRVQVLPETITRLGPTRQYLLDNNTGKVVLLDDDLVFAQRMAANRFDIMDPETTGVIFDLVENALDEYAHAGVLGREGANRVPPGHQIGNRMMRVLGYNFNVLRKHGMRFDRLEARSDFDMTLQLFRAGYPNWLTTDYVHDQRGGSNAKGGCSAYRDETVLEQSAQGLAALHPGFVKLTTKTTRWAWGGDAERTEVRIAWKKALYGGTGRVPK